MLKINSETTQLRQNRNLLHLLGATGTIAGIIMWSSTPFILASPKGNFQVTLRYLSLIGSLGLGAVTVVTASQLERIKPYINAIETAERDDFLTQLANSQYRQELHWQQEASQPLFQPTSQLPFQLPEMGSDAIPSVSAVSDSGSNGSDAETADCYKPLFHAVTLLQQQGMSETKIIETVLGKRGRAYGEGKAILAELLQLGQDQGW